MKRSLIALLLTLALVVTVSVFAVSANNGTATTTPDYTLTIADGVATAACPCSEHKGAVATFTAWTGVPSTAGGHYYLAENFEADGQKALKTMVLHLNGHHIKRTNKGAAVALHGSSTVTILDNPANKGGIKNNIDSGAGVYSMSSTIGPGGLISVNNTNTTLNIYGGTYKYTETTATLTGGLIGVGKSSSTVHIYGGVFEGGSTVSTANGLGGAFGVTAGKLYIHGGTIQNSSAGRGGSIYATTSAAEVHIDGGLITGGSATSRGGNIALVNGAKGFVSGGTITLGTVTGDIYSGGNIYVESASHLTVDEGAIITDGDTGKTGSYGGGNLCYRGSGGGGITINGGTISGGSAVKGGNIFAGGAGGTITLNGGNITNGFSYGTQIGGNIDMEDTTHLYIQGDNVNISGGFTTDKTTRTEALANKPTATTSLGAGRGGNICLRGSAQMTMTKGTVSGGNAPSGGNINVEASAKASISGGTVTGGFASSKGGNIQVYGTAASGSTAAKVAELTISGNATISSGNSATCGGVYANNDATVNISGGTILNNHSTNSGANLRFNSGTVTLNMSSGTISGGVCTSTSQEIGGGNFYCPVAATLNITGGTFSGGNVAGNGGNVLISKANNASKIENVTFSNGIAGRHGGNVYISALVNFKNCTISGGQAKNLATSVKEDTGVKTYGEGSGGNLYITAEAAGITFTDCEITGGIAGGTDTEGTIIKESYTNTVTGKTETAYINGRGGNVAVFGAATFTNCVVRNGKSYANNPCGGNIYINGAIGTGKQITIDSCTITGGYAYYSGGNIQHHGTGDVVITGDSYIAEGKAGTFGGNIMLGTQNAAVLYVEGNTEINSKNSSAGGNNGVNIHVPGPQSLYLGGNARIVSDKTQHSIAVAGAGKVHLSGNVYMNSYLALYADSHNVSATKKYAAGRVIAEEGFTGDVLLLTYYKATSGTNTGLYDTVENWAVGGSTVNFGAEAPAYLQAGENYNNTGTIKVHSKGRSGYVTVYNPETDKFIIAGYTALVPLAGVEGEFVEKGVAGLDSVPADAVSVKLYCNGVDGKIEVPAALDDLPIDQNNQNVEFITDHINTLKVFNYRTRQNMPAAPVPFTVDNNDKVALTTDEPETRYTYLNIYDEEKGTWTSNCVIVEMKKVSLRPYTACTNETEHAGAKCCGIYYTAKIKANAKATACLTNYGIIAGLGNAAGITEDWDANYKAGFRWTKNELKPNTDLYNGGDGVTFNSGLITDIISTANLEDAEVLEDAVERGSTPIGAKAYVIANIGGNEVPIFADKEANCSVMNLADKLAEMYADSKDDSIEKFLNSDFNTVMREWTEATNLQKFYGLA